MMEQKCIFVSRAPTKNDFHFADHSKEYLPNKLTAPQTSRLSANFFLIRLQILAIFLSGHPTKENLPERIMAIRVKDLT